MRPYRELNAIMDAAVKNKLTRAQCLEILNAPYKAKMGPFAERFGVRISFVRHVRYKCKWMLDKEAREL